MEGIYIVKKFVNRNFVRPSGLSEKKTYGCRKFSDLTYGVDELKVIEFIFEKIICSAQIF